MRQSTMIFPILLIATLAAQAADPAGAVRQAEKRWAAAVMAQDFAALEKIYHDDLIYAHSTGNIESKLDYLGRLRGGKQKYQVIDHTQLTVRVLGDAAIAHSKVRMAGTSDGAPFDNVLMMMHLWVKAGPDWRLAAHQTTKLAE